MAGRSVNVELRVKAQDEASKALDTVAKSLKDLGSAGTALQGGSGGVQKYIEDLSKNLGSLDAVSTKFEAGIEKIGRAEEILGRRLSGLSRTVDTQKAKLEELIATRERYQRQLEKGFVGPVEQGVNNNALRGVDKDIGALTKSVVSSQRDLDATISKIADGRESLRTYRLAQIEVEKASLRTTDQLLRQEQALEGLIDAEERAARAQSRRSSQAASVAPRINEVTGVSSTSATANGAGFGALEEQFKSIKRYAQDVAEAIDPAAKATRLMAEETQRLNFAVANGFLSQGQADAQLERFKADLDASATSARKAGVAYDQLEVYVQELRRDYDRAGYAAAFLDRETKKLDAAVKAGILPLREREKALEAVRRKSEQLGEQTNPQLFGLNPYQTQNLLYQFNDIATQLASGTSLSQTLAQQGGQILQLFPRVGNSVIGAMRAGGAAIAATVAILGTLVVGIKSAADEASRLRTFEGVLAATNNAAGGTAAAFGDVQKAIDRYGTTAEEALNITRRLAKEGFDTSQIATFAKTAKDMSDVLGSDLNTNVNLLTDAFNGNFDALDRLMRETNAFTGEQRSQIQTLYEQGRATEAVDMAFGILSKNMSEGARLARGPWTEAFRNLGNAWDDLVTQLGNTWWAQAALDGINALAGALDFLTGRSKAARDAEAERMGIYGQTPNRYDPATDPLYNAAVRGTPNDPALQKRDREDMGTPEQVANAQKLTKEAQRQAILAKEIKSQADVEAKLKVIRAQAEETIGNSVVATERARIVGLRVDAQRIEYAKQLETYNKRQADEAERATKAQNTGLFQAKALLRELEGIGGKFSRKAYNDEGTPRLGFGSDTITNPDGTYRRVRYGDTTTQEGAERDLDRRINKIIDVLEKRLGTERFRDFSAQQQGALVSLYYNYGIDSERLAKTLEPELVKGNEESIAAAVRKLANDRTASERAAGRNLGRNGRPINFARRMREADILAQPNLSVAEGAREFQQQEEDKLAKYNTEFDKRLSAEERSIANRRELIGLQGDELRAAILRQRTEEAILKETEALRQATGNPNAELSTEARGRIATTVAVELRLDQPAQQYAELQKQLSDLQANKGLLQADLEQARNEGNIGAVNQIGDQIDDVNDRIGNAAKALLDFVNTPGNPEALGLYGVELENVRANLEQITQQTAEWQLRLGGATITARDFANAFSNTAVNAIEQFAQAIANGQNAFSSLWTAFRQFAADFLLQIARMIQQQIIFNLVSGLLSSIGGGLGGGAGAATNSLGGGFSNFNLSGLQFHSGGIVGSGGQFRSINPAMLANAARYHSGGIAGLKPGEVPSILMRGEEVLTRDDPRHMLNGGGGRGDVKIVNTFDEADFFSKGANTKAGEKAILNLVRSNPRAFKQAMGGA